MKVLRIVAASLFLLAMLSLTSSAFAAGNYPPDVKGKVITRGGHVQPAPHVAPNIIHRAPPPAAPTLPFTGGDVVMTTLIGLAIIGTGTVLWRRFRVRTDTQTS
jgi:hypothetical protein